jgi:lipocalin
MNTSDLIVGEAYILDDCIRVRFEGVFCGAYVFRESLEPDYTWALSADEVEQGIDSV